MYGVCIRESACYWSGLDTLDGFDWLLHTMLLQWNGYDPSHWSVLGGFDRLQQGLHYATGVDWVRPQAIRQSANRESLMGLIGCSNDYTMVLESH